jgi:hypothetical protein
MGQDRATSAVVLVDLSACRELAVVETVLAEALNTPSVRISDQQLPKVRVSLEIDARVLVVDGQRIRPTVVWIRHTSAPAVWANRSGHFADRPFLQESWSLFLSQVTAIAAASIPGREPGHVDQLSAAARLGVAVPRTTVTTSLTESPAHRDAAATVVKVLGLHFAGQRDLTQGYFAEVFDGSRSLPSWADSRAPVIVQEYVEHVRELRVYFLNGGICAFDVRKPCPGSIWTAPDRVWVSPVDCPPAVAEVVRRLAVEWNLRYGAFDLLVTPAGRPVFLEVNADGDWLWFERKAGWSGVTLMAAAMIRDLHVEALRQAGAS